ncbi:Holliday junction resolvase RuvX [Candidatus Nomurabacteria bacterium CG10_big_fil_rev_8_21_14_0_10_03_31_7]|uniref:Putative pre-16S rRNA nuclease n=1 Tax=Candidatus Nomurabacteria bacterium CG10_big_fil_rev_8_21_14_0_10_03_31_7 TaxID=1974730 RepID=A0A2J0JIA8_9BACT|nr:MAG: Holliday junction resolvase RuvX [Candidatus Nomurabacteria bacterium CG10_big_fil_rev_8_21_14_0_10_03_31_7]
MDFYIMDIEIGKKEKISNGIRFLGIDYGTKRIGLAISDENGVLAFPKEIVLNDINIFKKLGEIIREGIISEIVIGESVDFSGKLNVLSDRIEVFILELEDKFKLPVYKQKEFLTSVEARKAGSSKKSLNQSQVHSKVKQIKSGRIDASAAALILQRYLDKINRH